MKNSLLLCAFMMIACCLHAQTEVIVSGNVTSASDGETLISVSVTETDGSNRVISGTVTDMNGDYVLRVKNPKNKIVFSYIGFKPQSFPIGESKKLNVKLQDEAMLEEVAVVAKKMTNDGGLNIPKREMSMAVSKISTREFEGLSTASIDDALQGRIAGLDIVANSGAPGSGSAMRIRGVTTITGNAQPLIVVNNIPYNGDVNSAFDYSTATEDQYADLLNISVDDIEEIVVLKDAASTSMWGSKGANGVLMITTKKGARGKTRVQYSYKLTSATQPKGMKMLSGDDYTMLMKQAYFNAPVDAATGRPVISEYNYDPSFPEYENFNENTDWVNAVTQHGWTHDHTLTVSGGGERAKFRISGGYFNQTGTNIGQELNRYTSRSELNYNVSDRITFTSEFQFTYSENDKNYDNLLNIAYKKMPNVAIYEQNEQGNSLGTYYNIKSNSNLNAAQKNLLNPVALAHLASNKDKNYRIIPTVRLSYNILEPTAISYLRYDGYVSFDMSNTKNAKFLPAEASNLNWDNSSVNKASSILSEGLTIQTENKFTFQTTLQDKHSIQAYASVQTAGASGHSQSLESYGHPDASLTEATSTAYLSNLFNGTSQERSIAANARVHYGYLGRYIFDGSVRMEGSTKFGPGSRYGTFPGVSAKWIISDEPFMKSFSNWLTLLAVRPSWGISGRQPDRNYLYFSRYTPDNVGYMGINATYPNSIQLTDLRWEKLASYNWGLDLEILDGKFTATLDLYHKRTTDLLFKDLNISSTSGFVSLTNKNVGTMDNDGWELDLSTYQLIKIGQFTMDFNINMAQNANKIIEMDPLVLAKYNEPGNALDNGKYLTMIQENNSFGSIYGLRYKGVYRYSYDNYLEGVRENAPVARDANGNVMRDYDGSPKRMFYRYNDTKYAFTGGDAIYEDINNDGSIDQYDVVYLGNSNPKLSGGFGTNIRYGSFSASVFCNFRYGNKIVNAARMEAENMFTDNNQCVTTNWRWRKEGDVTDMPRAIYNSAYNWVGSDRYVEDGSFIRLKYVTLRYALPADLLRQVGVNQMSLYLTMNNLLCLTNYSGVDPEVGYGDFGVSKDISKTPRPKDWALGFSVTF
jgi:TonB-linked SusC/RagA family outer membrane protein